jgi:hypothetical protein
MKKILSQENKYLIVFITREKIVKAIMLAPNNKTLELDNLSYELYKK